MPGPARRTINEPANRRSPSAGIANSRRLFEVNGPRPKRHDVPAEIALVPVPLLTSMQTYCSGVAATYDAAVASPRVPHPPSADHSSIWSVAGHQIRHPHSPPLALARRPREVTSHSPSFSAA
jgi:hypothetical protein